MDFSIMSELLLLESSKEDFFVCGNCKQLFTSLPAFLEHKRQKCVKDVVPKTSDQNPSKRKTASPSAGEIPEIGQSGVPPVNLQISQPTTDTAEIGETVFFCNLCKKAFKKMKTLLVHMKIHNGKPYQCQICGRCFGQNSHLHKHEMSHKVWPVGLSDTTAKTTTVDALSYTCAYCDKVLDNYNKFRAHLKHHISFKMFKCMQGECIKLVESMEELLHHVSLEHPDVMYSCHICSETFTSLADIAAHQQNHKQLNKDDLKSELYKCILCDAIFKRKDRLKLHQSTENHNKTCIHCNKTFVSDKRLRLHLQVHKETKSYQCHICNKSFHMKKYLNTHMLKHGERQFYCVDCSSTFKRKDLLQRHMRSHQTKKMFSCPFNETLGCKMEFTRNDKLKLHIRHHTKQLTSCSNKEKTSKLDATSTMEIYIVPFLDQKVDIDEI